MSDAAAPLSPPAAVPWPDPARHAAFSHWLARIAPAHGLDAASVRIASADASFRRYLRIDAAAGPSQGGVSPLGGQRTMRSRGAWGPHDAAAGPSQGGASRIIMDAPPAHENCAAFAHVAALMQQAGLNAPRVLDWDQAHGFMLLTDLGAHTLIDALDPAQPDAARPLYLQAIDPLLRWQQATRPGQLPPYGEALLKQELALFPDWYLARHRGVAVEGALRQTLDSLFSLIVARNLAAPMVYVHRDFMTRNLMQSTDERGIGILDFQDAVHGPVTYDIASLMRDAFISWDEELVLDLTIRYWQRARRAGLLDFEDWHADFGSFWRAVEWMGLQRHLKIAGIFARLTLRDGKPKYLADTPRFIAYIRHTAERYRELRPLLRLLDEVERSSRPD
jgi:aminoglycoside/choline kinase family phosphotransferase